MPGSLPPARAERYHNDGITGPVEVLIAVEPHHTVIDHAITAWIALSPVTADTDTMRMAVGTHNQDVIEHVDTRPSGAILPRGPHLVTNVDKDTSFDIEFAPGQLPLASPQNSASDAQRKARYTPAPIAPNFQPIYKPAFGDAGAPTPTEQEDFNHIQRS
jgi:hypothetical protein